MLSPLPLFSILIFFFATSGMNKTSILLCPTHMTINRLNLESNIQMREVGEWISIPGTARAKGLDQGPSSGTITLMVAGFECGIIQTWNIDSSPELHTEPQSWILIGTNIAISNNSNQRGFRILLHKAYSLYKHSSIQLSTPVLA